MSVAFDLSEETLIRLGAEAARRGVSIDEVIAELAAQLPAGTGRRPSFAGVGLWYQRDDRQTPPRDHRRGAQRQEGE